MDNSFNAGLALRRSRLRFVSAETEVDYRVWRNQRTIPVFRLNGFVSIIAWLFGPGICAWWMANYSSNPAEFNIPHLLTISYTLAIPTLIVMLAISYTRFSHFATSLTGLGLCVLALIMQYLSVTVGEPNALNSVTVAVVFACFGLFMKLPPLVAILAITPHMLTASYFLASAYANGKIASVDMPLAMVSLATTYFFISVMSMVFEKFTRQAYITETERDRQSAELQSTRALIQRYVPPAVTQQIIDGNEATVDQPTRKRVTVLFADIVGFTDVADQVEPEVMTQVLNDYMSTMADLIEQHGGTLNELAGDGLMSLFGAPEPMPAEEQAANAIRAAQAMQNSMPALNDGWRKLGLGTQLQIRIGINTGMLSVGSYGSQGRMTYTAIGLQTNIAARIESAAEPGTILIADPTWQLIRDEISCTAKGEVQCKGVHFPVKVYQPNPQIEALPDSKQLTQENPNVALAEETGIHLVSR